MTISRSFSIDPLFKWWLSRSIACDRGILGRMERQARVEYPNALHPVRFRGNSGQAVFLDDQDRIHFLQLLAQAVRYYGWLSPPLGHCGRANFRMRAYEFDEARQIVAKTWHRDTDVGLRVRRVVERRMGEVVDRG